MEGVGARLGRSSTRYGPAPVFTGPVRKWKKKWVHVSSSSSSSSSTTHNHRSAVNGSSANGGHLSFYKWTPITPSQNNVNGETKEDQVAPSSSSIEDETPKRRFKYVPIAVLEEQENEAEEYEAAELDDEKDKKSDTDPNAAEATAKTDCADEKPDINDVPMEESQTQDVNQVVRQDLNESTLDLSLGWNGNEGDHDSIPKADQSRDGELDRTNSSGAT